MQERPSLRAAIFIFPFVALLFTPPHDAAAQNIFEQVPLYSTKPSRQASANASSIEKLKNKTIHAQINYRSHSTNYLDSSSTNFISVYFHADGTIIDSSPKLEGRSYTARLGDTVHLETGNAKYYFKWAEIPNGIAHEFSNYEGVYKFIFSGFDGDKCKLALEVNSAVFEIVGTPAANCIVRDGRVALSSAAKDSYIERKFTEAEIAAYKERREREFRASQARFQDSANDDSRPAQSSGSTANYSANPPRQVQASPAQPAPQQNYQTTQARPQSSGCNDAEINRRLDATYGPRMRQARGMCDSARTSIAMLQDAKAAYSACLPEGTQLRRDTLLGLDAAIRQSQQTLRDAC